MATATTASLRLLLVHLRLPFQLLLAPIFMLGAFLGGARPTGEILLAFAAVHVGIYGGMTAFNSYYDRDLGPISLLKRSKPASRFVRDAAIMLQLVAVVILFLLRPLSAIPAAMLVAMGIAYSHPRWRWKASLLASLLAVSIGQGLLAFAVGYLSAGAPVAGLLHPQVLLGGAGSAVVTLGLYPVTQVYQVDEDRARGDRSLAVVFGWRSALRIAGLLLGAGVGLVTAALAGQVAPVWSWILAAGVVGMWVLLYFWSRRFSSLDAYANHDWALGLGALASVGFWILILSEWIRKQGSP